MGLGSEIIVNELNNVFEGLVKKTKTGRKMGIFTLRLLQLGKEFCKIPEVPGVLGPGRWRTEKGGRRGGTREKGLV